MRWGTFKPVLAEALVEHLRPIQVRSAALPPSLPPFLPHTLTFSLTHSLTHQGRYEEIMGDRAQLDALLAHGAAKANAVAEGTLADVRDAMGFLPPRRGP